MKENFSSLDEVLVELKKILYPIQLNSQQKFSKSNFPFGFIVGNPRSGTTLFLQWLSSLGCFSYPTNTLARFAYAPYIGALIQEMLFNKKYDLLNELNITDNEINFKSLLGKSSGYLDPNEFQHFFRNYIPNYFPTFIHENEFNNIDFKSMLQALISIENVFNKPFVTKAMLLQYNLADFYAQIPNSIFFYIKRDPFFVMQSIYMSRIKYYGDVTKWWSVKPKEYNELITKDIYQQIAGQVYHTDKAIEEELALIPENNKIIIHYEEFCDNPEYYLNEIKIKYSKNNCDLILNKSLIGNFKNTNKITIEEKEFRKLKQAYIDIKNKA